jgi:YHS domain-containing protein
MRRTAILLVLFFAVAAFGDAVIKPVGKLTKVEPKTVCMINEQAMGKDQIPVEVEGRTYYGCCEMCKKALSTDAAKRVSFDPVTGKQVDKATAVIAAQEDGRVFYFESDHRCAGRRPRVLFRERRDAREVQCGHHEIACCRRFSCASSRRFSSASR